MARNHGLHVERGSNKKPLSLLDLLLVLRVVHLKQAELLAVVCHCFCKEESYSEEMEPSILFQEWGWILRVYIQFVESIYIYIYMRCFCWGVQIWPLNLWGRRFEKDDQGTPAGSASCSDTTGGAGAARAKGLPVG